VNTHSHIDHIYNNYVFKGARIYTPSSIWYRDGDDRAEIYGDITKVEIPVVELINTPGHMENHISVVVKSKGKTFVVAGDAVRESIIKSGYAPKVYSHPQTYIKSLKKIFAIADVIIPGHGPTIDGKRLAELKEKVAKIKVEGED